MLYNSYQEPLCGHAGHVDGVGPLAGLHLVHVLVVLEEGVPVVARGERGLGLGSADLLVANEIYIHKIVNFTRMGQLVVLGPDVGRVSRERTVDKMCHFL